MLIIDKCIYSDLNYDTVERGTPPLIVNKDAIFYSLHNLLTTNIGERLNLVTYGVNVPDQLFEQIDNETADKIRLAFINAVNQWEPRVRIDLFQSTVKPNEDENSYDVKLVFNLVGINEASIMIAGQYKKQFSKEKM